MFLLRRTAARAFAASSSTAFVAKPRSINTFAVPAFRARQQKLPILSFQRRFASDDAVNTEETKAAEHAVAEAPESFAQTAAEAPVEENLTPAEQSVQASASDPFPDSGDVAWNGAAGSKKNDFVPNKTIYVGNLYYDIKKDQLERVFSRFGEVVDVQIVMDNRGLSRGFGYVVMKELDHAAAAIENLDQQVLEGRNLVVQYHKPKEHSKSLGRDGKIQPNQPSKVLFIGNMSYEMSDKDLNDLFRQVRNVLDVRVAIDRRTGQPRGFAHADFVDVASAVRAREILQEKVMYGRQLRVDFSKATSRERRRPDRSSEESRPSGESTNATENA